MENCYTELIHNTLTKAFPSVDHFQNTEAYVVDAQLNLCPIGVPGELLLGGDGVARGYLNRPELTKEKFIDNPFDKTGNSRLYRTGDFVRRLANGDIVFLGRIDDQVKIRGYRVEPLEVEAILDGLDAVDDSVVVARQKPKWYLVFSSLCSCGK